MTRFGWALTAILISLMGAIEVLEGHAIYLVMIASGCVGLLAWNRCPGNRPWLRQCCGGLGFALFFLLGLIHWCDGVVEMLDWVALAVVFSIAAIVFGRFHWVSRRENQDRHHRTSGA